MIQRPANEVWVDDPAPGGWICGVCLYPVESEPCEQHDGAALTDEQLAWLATEHLESIARAVASVTPCSCSAQRARAESAEARLTAVGEAVAALTVAAKIERLGERADVGELIEAIRDDLRAVLDGGESR
mgnify:CR=1 FL=1